MLESLLEQYKQNTDGLKLKRRERIAFSMAKSAAVKRGKTMDMVEMQSLLDQLFTCEQPGHAPDGKPTFVMMTLEELDKRFGR